MKADPSPAPRPVAVRPSRPQVAEHLALALVLVVLAASLWLALGMQRGLLLASDVKSRVWPWAPTLHAERLQAESLTDPVWQFVPWLQFARGELQAGRLPLWNPHQDGGVPLLGNGISALLSPLVWPVLALGVERGWNLSLLCRLLALAAGTWVWLRELGRSRSGALLGAVMVAVSGPVVAWLEHPHTLALAGAPWLLAGVERLGERPGRGPWLLIVLSTWLVLVGGHPETAMMIAIVAAARLLVVGWRRRLRVVWGCGAAVTGALLAAPALAPLLEYLALSEARSGAGRHAFVLPWSALGGFLRPLAGGGAGIEGAVSVSLVGLGMAAIGVALARRERRLWFWIAGAVAVISVVFASPFSRWLATVTTVYWTRALLLLPLLLAPLAARGLDAVARRLPQGRRWTHALPTVAALVAGVELLGAARGVHAVTPAEWAEASTPLVERLRSEPGPFRVLPLHTFLPPNTATQYGLDDLRGYDALAPAGFRREREAIGRFTGTSTVSDVIEPWDLAPGGEALDFWNVKYLLLHPQFPLPPAWFKREFGLDLREVYSRPDGRIFENLRALPRARLGSGGRVGVVAALPTRWELSVEAAGDDLLTVANPYFPGWRVTVDGLPVRLRARPGEAMKVPLSAGRHRVAVRYWPASLSLGLALALVGLAVAGASLAWLSRRPL